MYDWSRQSWAAMLRDHLAAQGYPKEAYREPSNIERLEKLEAGDKVLAAFKRHRFGGYGTLRSELSRGRRGLLVRSNKGEREIFREVFDCDWTDLGESERAFIKCDDLKKKGFRVDMSRGLCVAPSDARTFREVKARIDNERKRACRTRDLESIEGEEGREKGRFANYYERKPKLRNAAIELHGENCMACGFNFGSRYGERGEGFVEVHHMKPIGARGKRTRVRPKTDMVVVCSNCHRMIHRRKDDVWSPARLRRDLKP
jgi:hypothetical protein